MASGIWAGRETHIQLSDFDQNETTPAGLIRCLKRQKETDAAPSHRRAWAQQRARDNRRQPATPTRPQEPVTLLLRLLWYEPLSSVSFSSVFFWGPWNRESIAEKADTDTGNPRARGPASWGGGISRGEGEKCQVNIKRGFR